MKLQNLRFLSLLAANFFAVSVADCITSPVQADTLPPIEVNGPDCGAGVPVFNGDRFVTCIYLGIGSGGGGGGGMGGGGFVGGGGALQGTQVPGKAPGGCNDETAEGAAGDMFRAWKLATDKNSSLVSAPDHKDYTVTFSDNRSQTFNWGLPLQASLPLQITDGKCN
jgi:hypothetical protein